MRSEAFSPPPELDCVLAYVLWLASSVPGKKSSVSPRAQHPLRNSGSSRHPHVIASSGKPPSGDDLEALSECLKEADLAERV